MLQHLPGQQEPGQPDHSQGHPHPDAQRHLLKDGGPSCKCFHTTVIRFCQYHFQVYSEVSVI